MASGVARRVRVTRHPCQSLVSRLAGLPGDAHTWEGIVADAIRAAPSLAQADVALAVPRSTCARWHRWLVNHGHELPAPRPGWRPGAPLPPTPTPDQARAAGAAGGRAKASRR